jgi:hypothetical protein
VADWEAGLQVLNVADPAHPRLVATLGLGTFPHPLGGLIPEVGERIFVSGNYAYVTGYALHVIDVSEPAQPVRVGGYSPTGGNLGLFVAGPYAYLVGAGEGGNDLTVVDVSDPGNPQPVGGYAEPGRVQVYDVFVTGGYAFLANHEPFATGDGLLVLDVSDPAHPERVGGAALLSGALGITVAGRYAYLAGGDRLHLQVFDISNPAQPRRVGGNTAIDPSAVTVVGGNVYAAARGSDLAVLELFYDPGPLRLEILAPPTPGSLRFLLHGPPGMSGRIERSANLWEWQDWQPFKLGNNPIQFVDALAFPPANQFYRAVSP